MSGHRIVGDSTQAALVGSTHANGASELGSVPTKCLRDPGQQNGIHKAAVGRVRDKLTKMPGKMC